MKKPEGMKHENVKKLDEKSTGRCPTDHPTVDDELEKWNISNENN